MGHMPAARQGSPRGTLRRKRPLHWHHPMLLRTLSIEQEKWLNGPWIQSMISLQIMLHLDGFEEVDEDEDEGYASARGKKSRKLKEIAQFYDQRWSRRRMISDVSFSPKVSQRHHVSYRALSLTNQNHSLQNFSSHPTPKTPPHHKIHQVSSNSGACTSALAQNTSSTPPPTSSPPNSPPFTHGTSSAGPTRGKSSSGTCAIDPLYHDSKPH